MSQNKGWNQWQERYKNHWYYFWYMFTPENFKIRKWQTSKKGRNNLRLITYTINSKESEIPNPILSNFRRWCRCYWISIKQLWWHQTNTQNNSKNLASSHFTRNRPSNTYRQELENSFTRQPQEVIHSWPELRNLGNCLTVKHWPMHTLENITETKD